MRAFACVVKGQVGLWRRENGKAEKSCTDWN